MAALPPNLGTLERYRELIDDWPSFAAAAASPLPTTLWANTLRIARERLAEWLAEDGIATRPLGWYGRGLRLEGLSELTPGKTLAYLTGCFHVQEEVSMLPIALLDPQPGEKLLDLCAAPGNKTVQAVVHMADRGTVLAVDRNEARLGMVVRNIERLGLTAAATFQVDASSLPRGFDGFDRVLADVPCSCEGTSRKSTEVLHRSSLVHEGFAEVQLAILRKAFQRCRPGGRIVYSTCTYAPEENEMVVDQVLSEQGGRLRLLPISAGELRLAPGLEAWQGRRFDPELRRTARLFPHWNDTGGFFVASLEKCQ